MAFALTAAPASAQVNSPVAIVEEASDDAPINVFDYLLNGDKFVLPNGATVVIGYMSSCRRETVKGGEVIIGEVDPLGSTTALLPPVIAAAIRPPVILAA